MSTWQFTIWGDPQARKSHRTSRIKMRDKQTGELVERHIRRDPSASAKAEIRAQILAQDAKPPELIPGPKVVLLHVFRTRPKSLPKRVKWPVSRPDVDNYTKLIFDAFNGFVWHDDSEVVRLEVTKSFADEQGPRFDVYVSQVE